MANKRHFYWDVTLHAEADTAEEAWEIALDEFVNARIPCPEPIMINTEPDTE